MTTRRRILAFIIGFTLMWGVLGTQRVFGQTLTVGPTYGFWHDGVSTPPPSQCPPDRPIKRFVQQPLTTCTLAACWKMVCDKDSDRCQMVTGSDCNTCYRAPDVEICLSQEELDRAK